MPDPVVPDSADLTAKLPKRDPPLSDAGIFDLSTEVISTHRIPVTAASRILGFSTRHFRNHKDDFDFRVDRGIATVDRSVVERKLLEAGIAPNIELIDRSTNQPPNPKIYMLSTEAAGILDRTLGGLPRWLFDEGLTYKRKQYLRREDVDLELATRDVEDPLTPHGLAKLLGVTDGVTCLAVKNGQLHHVPSVGHLKELDRDEVLEYVSKLRPSGLDAVFKAMKVYKLFDDDPETLAHWEAQNNTILDMLNGVTHYTTPKAAKMLGLADRASREPAFWILLDVQDYPHERKSFVPKDRLDEELQRRNNPVTRQDLESSTKREIIGTEVKGTPAEPTVFDPSNPATLPPRALLEHLLSGFIEESKNYSSLRWVEDRWILRIAEYLPKITERILDQRIVDLTAESIKLARFPAESAERALHREVVLKRVLLESAKSNFGFLR